LRDNGGKYEKTFRKQTVVHLLAKTLSLKIAMSETTICHYRHVLFIQTILRGNLPKGTRA
jgi:hypothetical protein